MHEIHRLMNYIIPNSFFSTLNVFFNKILFRQWNIIVGKGCAFQRRASLENLVHEVFVQGYNWWAFIILWRLKIVFTWRNRLMFFSVLAPLEWRYWLSFLWGNAASLVLGISFRRHFRYFIWLNLLHFEFSYILIIDTSSLLWTHDWNLMSQEARVAISCLEWRFLNRTMLLDSWLTISLWALDFFNDLFDLMLHQRRHLRMMMCKSLFRLCLLNRSVQILVPNLSLLIQKLGYVNWALHGMNICGFLTVNGKSLLSGILDWVLTCISFDRAGETRNLGNKWLRWLYLFLLDCSRSKDCNLLLSARWLWRSGNTHSSSWFVRAVAILVSQLR